MTVTCWFAAEFDDVKVRLFGITVTSGLLELIATVTSDVGAVFSFTPYVPTPPSPTVNDAGVKLMPGLSSSSTVTLTDAVTPAYSPPKAVLVTVTVSLAESSSSTPATVTVCSVSQVDAVKMRLEPLAVAGAAPRSSELTVTVTVTVGCVFSFTV